MILADIWSCPACGHALDDGPPVAHCRKCQDPGTITDDQRLDLLDRLIADGVPRLSVPRGDWIRARFPEWKHGGDLGWLTAREAAWLVSSP